MHQVSSTHPSTQNKSIFILNLEFFLRALLNKRVEERKKLVSEQVNSSAAFLLKCLLFHFKSSIFNIPRHTIN